MGSRALQYLAARQQRLAARLPRQDPAELRAKRSRALEELWDALGSDEDERARLREQHDAQMPTPWQHPFFYGLLDGLLTSLVELVREDWKGVFSGGARLERLPVIGTLPSGHLNALTLRMPDSGELVVALNDAVFVLLNLASKAFVTAFPGEAFRDRGGDVRGAAERATAKSLAQIPQLETMFWDLLHATVVAGNPAASPVYILEPESLRDLAMKLCTGAEVFVVAHELAHTLLGHLDGEGVKAALGPDGDADLESLLRAWPQEYAADRLGALMAIPAATTKHGLEAIEAYAAIELWFVTIDLIHRALSLLEHGDERALAHDTHPPPRRRADIVASVVTELFPDPGERATAIDLAEAVRVTMETLWVHVRERWLRQHADGVRPAPIWGLTLAHGASLKPRPPQFDARTAAGVRVVLRSLLTLGGDHQREAARLMDELAMPAAIQLLDDLTADDRFVVERARTLMADLLPGEARDLPYIVGLLRAFGRHVPLSKLPVLGLLHQLAAAIDARAAAIRSER